MTTQRRFEDLVAKRLKQHNYGDGAIAAFLEKTPDGRYYSTQTATWWEMWSAGITSYLLTAGGSQAAHDVLAERQRQVEAEGWTPAHDDEHDSGDLAAAASAYALHAADELEPHSLSHVSYNTYPPEMWPFAESWFKPEDPRRALVKAAALLLAEIERFDRAEVQP